MTNPQPPISPADAGPRLETRDDLKAARVDELVEARTRVRKARHETAALHNRDPTYTRANANSEYLDALQNLIMELETIYTRLETKPEYWDRDEGEPLAVLRRPPLDADELIDPPPDEYNVSGDVPRYQNPEALDAEVLDVLYHLPDLLAYDSAEVSYRVVLHPTAGKQDRYVHHDSMVISRAVLDRARRWCFEFWEAAGISLERQEDNHAVIGGGGRYGDD